MFQMLCTMICYVDMTADTLYLLRIHITHSFQETRSNNLEQNKSCDKESNMVCICILSTMWWALSC